MKATFYGHATIALELAGANVLFDPFITPNEQAKHIDINTLKPDYIMLSHAHEDHVADVAAIQKNSDATVVAIVETAAWVGRQGINQDKIIAFNFGGTLKTSFGTAKMVYALHTNGTPDQQYGGVAAGYLIKSGDKKIYFAGDTALTLEMKLLADEQLDWAILPIGDHYTMGVDDAIKAAGFVTCKNIIGIHYNTFPPIKINEEEAKQKFAAAGLNLHLLAIGESITL
ncbi:MULTISPECIES: metal-dependent hydrolase [Olivibacter]|jgi:L-ascorbate metabolism protein UlaG (beta-lactamase superfamily)|uniref:Metal-dependent hydrolase n=1 Tax=Olivibacter oleidegradans TaxID=760123 RepID=A0ABV6HI65_9SPHI|nr:MULTISPECIES: metal-dependent hydrolase [Olivibacter]QEL00099.1 metal-dependent hydrolase [Olivibacter sp. LS-1]